MSLVKGKQEHRTILDVSKHKKVSKNFVRQSLRKAEVLDTNGLKFVLNEIKVGIYHIYLDFPEIDSFKPRHRLREYRGVGVHICSGQEEILLDTDKRFCEQRWSDAAHHYAMRLDDLVDAVVHCSRLNKLRVFS